MTDLMVAAATYLGVTAAPGGIAYYCFRWPK